MCFQVVVVMLAHSVSRETKSYSSPVVLWYSELQTSHSVSRLRSFIRPLEMEGGREGGREKMRLERMIHLSSLFDSCPI